MKILITAGLGDFITMDAFLSDDERNAITEVYFAARGRYGIESLIDAAPVFPNLKRKVTVWDSWTNSRVAEYQRVFAIQDKDHLFLCNQEFEWGLDEASLSGVLDYSISKFFPQIQNHERRYTGGVLLKDSLAEISKFNLPERFGIVNPYSTSDKHFGGRDFDKFDWRGVIRCVKRLGEPAVVINNCDHTVPDDPILIDLSNQTTVAEALEISKQGTYYIGIDSWISAMMPRFLSADRLFIKTENKHYLQSLPIYCVPHTKFNFVRRSLADLI